MANILEINRTLNKITLGTTGTTINIASHTASKILALDGSKNLEVVTIGSSLDYTRPTLNTIQDIRTSASPTFAGFTKIGDASNHITVASDGEITLVGTARVMKSVSFEPDALKKGGVGPADNTEDNFPTHDYDATNDESVFVHWEIPHDYASVGVIHIHFEFFVDTAPGSTEYVTFGVEYRKLSIGDNFSFSGTTTVIANTAITSGTPANDKKIHITSEISLVVTGFEPGDIILFRFFRDANASEGDASDNFGNDVRVFNYHLEYLRDKIGETT